MRLQLIALAAAIAGAGDARADPEDEPEARAALRIYADDDHVTVVSPSAAVAAAIGRSLTLDGDVTADVVTGASVDVVTSASPRTVHERRIEAGLALTRELRIGDASRISALGRASHENDYDSFRAGLAIHTELAAHNTVLELRYLGGADQAGDVTDAMFRRTRTTSELVASVSQVLGPRTVATLVVDATLADGYHGSPYRLVPVTIAAMPVPLRVGEVTPSARRSIAVSAQVRRAFGDRWFVTLDDRGYLDDWAVTSETATAEVLRTVGDRVLLGATMRVYLQGGARFYRGAYLADPDVPTFRTRDRTLGPMRSLFVSTTADVALDDDDRWHLVAAAGVLDTWFLDSPAQSERRALVLTGSLAHPF
jgi:hypothetical protein